MKSSIDKNLFMLFQINDSLFPIGAYSHSYGLETYIQKKLVTNVDTAFEYLKCNLKFNFLYSELLAINLSYEYADKERLDKLIRLDNILNASKSPKEIRLASQKLGSRFIKTLLSTEINYKNNPVRVTPLRYADLVKWFTNKKAGIPAYIKIDMATQQTELVRLKEGMKYTPYDHFGRYLYRHLRFKYPTYMFDDISFEIDESGTPYWICPVKKYNIGLFGGVTIGRVVLCNAVTGEMTDYAVEDVPQWVDRVYSADMLISLYDYHGTLKHGYFNSVLSQKDCLVTTDGYNYIALDDDVWVYTGITSVGQDKSNVGFVLMNQRTMETRYYVISGAEENSAMSSAEGKVQHLGYKATFPLLINVGGQPTYFMALKDSSGLVKSYAMLNIEKYQTVAIGDSVNECEKNYRQLMVDSGIVDETAAETPKESRQITGRIEKMVQTVLDGNSHFYILLEGQSRIFDVPLSDNADIVRYNTGDTVTFSYHENESLNEVTKVEAAQQTVQ